MKTPNKEPLIYSYIDFRVYLSDYYEFRKARESHFTHGKICQLLGQNNSRSYFSNIVKGRTPIGESTVSLFCKKVLKLKDAEANYFRHLVHYTQCKDPDEKSYYFDLIVQANHTPREFISKNQYEYYSNLLPSILRALVDVIPYNDEMDFKVLANALRFTASVHQVKQGFELLKELKLIEFANNRYLPSSKAISTQEKVRDHLILKYQLQALDQGKKAILIKDERTQTVTQTLSVSSEARKKMERCIEKMRSELRTIAHKDNLPAEEVFQLNLQFYPITKEPS